MPHSRRPMPTLSGYIDEITAAGWVAGWAWDETPANRLHIGIFAGPELVAEAAADRFRADLLHAGKGLGHCGFLARWRGSLSADEVELRLQDRRSGRPIGLERRVPVPKPGAEDRTYVFRSSGWSVADVLHHLDRFELGRHCREMGPERFVDVSYRFCLDRWPEAGEADDDVRNLLAGTLDPEDFLRFLLRSDARRATAEPLPGAFDPRFPFRSFVGENGGG